MIKGELLRKMLLVLSIAFCALNCWSAPLDLDESNKQIVEKCKNLEFADYCSYLDRLGQEKNIAALTAISKAGLPNSYYAVGVICRTIDDDKAIALCSRLQLNSLDWQHAIDALADHKKEGVIGYIKQIATSTDPNVRAECYRVCLRAGWSDLEIQATKDASSSERLYGHNEGIGMTLGRVSQTYLKYIKKK